MKIDFTKGLVPAIIQNYLTGEVLMLGYMNEEAYQQSLKTKLVTFYSRSKQRLWVKGETSGNFLDLIEVKTDCDSDAILVHAQPRGVTCHTGSRSCFGDSEPFIFALQSLIQKRKKELPNGSYTTQLFTSGLKRISQKVGEEAVEVVIESMDRNTEKLKQESADLLFHLSVLLAEHELSFEDIFAVLAERNKK